MSNDARIAQAIRKLIPGSLGGQYKGAQPVIRALIDRGPKANTTEVCPVAIDTTETFNKANGTLGPEMTWTVNSGTMEVVSNQCKENSGSFNQASATPTALADGTALDLDADMTVSVEVVSFTSGGVVDNPLLLHARRLASAFVYLQLWTPTAGSTPNRWELGTDSGILTSGTIVWLTAGNVIGLGVAGTTATAYLNGAAQLTATVPAPGYGSTHSCRLFLAEAGTIDNFTLEGQTVC